MKLTRSLVAALPVLAVAFTATVPVAEAGPVCQAQVSGKAKRIVKHMALLSARISWKAAAVNLHGAPYGSYKRAKAKSEKCWKDGNKWWCVVRARPCKAGFGGPDAFSS